MGQCSAHTDARRPSIRAMSHSPLWCAVWVDWLQNPIRWTAFIARQADRYGLALLVGYRVAGAVIILTLYYTLEWGVPVRRLEELAAHFGYATDSRLVGTATKYAGAIVCSAALFPFTLMLAPFLARGFHKTTRAVLGRGKGNVTASTSQPLQQKTPPH